MTDHPSHRRRALCVSPYCHLDQHGQPDPRPHAPRMALCWSCANRAVRDAGRAGRLHEDLTLAMLPCSQHGEKVRTATGQGLTPHPEITDAREQLLGVLTAWTKMVCDERQVSPPSEQPGPLVGFLARHGRWLAAHPAAGDWAAEMHELATDPRARRLAYPVRGDGVPIGACPDCGARLVARADRPIVACRCGASATLEQWRSRLLGDQPDQLVDAYAAAAHLALAWRRPVDAALIRKWAHRGHIARRDHDKRGRALYGVDELLDRARHVWGDRAAA